MSSNNRNENSNLSGYISFILLHTVGYTGSVPNSSGTGPTEINKLMDKVELNEDDDEDTGSKVDDLSETAAGKYLDNLSSLSAAL